MSDFDDDYTSGPEYEDYGDGDLYGYNDHDNDDDSDDEDEDYGDDYYGDWEEENDQDDSDEDGYGAATRIRSRYMPEISPAAIRRIIQDAMAQENNIKEEDIPDETPFISPKHNINSSRYFETKGFAWFSCPQKHHRWPSAQSWCFIDLKTQSICYRDKQKCKKCESEAPPEFTEESLQKMAAYVVKKYLIKTKRLQPVYSGGTDTAQTQGGPHDEERCGKCKRLRRSCWK